MTVKNKAPSEKEPYELALIAASSSPPDLLQANALLQDAHLRGDRRATYAIATWYLYGNAVYTKNLRKAIRWLKLAVDADIASAHFDLAVSYETGQGVKKSEKSAYRHYLAAALNGDNNAVSEVGRCLYHGIGTTRDRRAAEIWFRRADAVGVDVR
jgi:TPR repeat protein